MKNVPDKFIKQITTYVHFRFDNVFVENHAVYEIKWRYIVVPDRPQTMHMRTVCWLPKATNTHSEYTGCHRRNGPNFGRVFLMLNYTDITQNTYI